MAGNLTSLSNNGIPTQAAPASKSSSERQTNKAVGELSRALETGDTVAARGAVAALKSAAPTQNGQVEFQNAVKALDKTLASNDIKGAREAFAGFQQVQQRRTAQQGNGATRQQAPEANPAPPPRQGARGEAPRGAEATAQRQHANAGQQAHQAAEQSFITRRDLIAKSASAPTVQSQPGRLIDTTA